LEWWEKEENCGGRGEMGEIGQSSIRENGFPYFIYV